MKDMGISWKWLIQILVNLIGPILSLISPAIKAALNEFLTNLYLDALKTPNPWDDFLVGLLLDILAIPRPPPV
jgi:hypothetical protein